MAICIATKGIEQRSGAFAHELLLKHTNIVHFAVLSGPTFAIDLASDTVCALTVGTCDNDTKKKMSQAFTSNHVRLKQSDSTKAFFENRALHEMVYLIEMLGGNRDTILTLAGIGDFILTCNSLKSRNYTYGTKVGLQSSDLEEYENNTTIEGLYTLKSLEQLIKRKNLSAPLVNIIYDICVKKENPEQLLTTLVEI